VHRTSRNGDPQLHTHLLAANVVHGADGRWSAPDARGIYFHARTAGFVYQAALRAGLADSLGLSFGPVRNGTAEPAGIDAGVLRQFSTRKMELETYLNEFGGTSGRTAELAALATRAPKGSKGDREDEPLDLRTQWRARAEELDVDVVHLFAQMGSLHRLGDADHRSPRDLVDEILGPEGLTAQDSTFERRDVVRAVAERMPDGAYLEDIERLVEVALSRPEAVSLERPGRGGETLHSTTELLSVERDLIQGAVDWVAAHEATSVMGVVVDLPAEFSDLSEDQASMVQSLVSSGQPIEIVVGKAGAGKTTALSAARQILQDQGWTVSGTALSARAAQELEHSAGIESVTLTRFLGQLDDRSRALGSRHLVVVDEAGMVGTRTLARLAEVAQESGAKLVLVGDPRQLPEIDAGGAFAALAARLGALELTENRRQHELWERVALDHLRSGDVAQGLAAYDDHGRIHLSGSMAEARSELVGHWLTARDEGEEVLMLAVNRRDVRTLNDLARTELQRRGTVGPDLDTATARQFALGDEVVCLRNARPLSVINGTRGTVAGFDGEHLVIETASGQRLLPLGYLEAGHLDYGYATTVHKAQGATYDRAFVLATDALTREAGYVAMSRARHGTELFVPGGTFEQGLGPEVREAEPLARTAARLATSRAKSLASSSLPDRMLGHRTFGLNPPVGECERNVDRVSHVLASMDSSTTYAGINFATDFSGPEPAAYVVAALGPRPAFVDEQPRYDEAAQSITRYRDRYEVEGDDPLGPRPSDSFDRLEYDLVAAEIRGFERRRWRELEAPAHDLGLGR
jgi:hypothetical protein